MLKLIELEWRKLDRKKVIGEVIIYWFILMLLPVFFIQVVLADQPIGYGDSYAAALELMMPIQMGMLLFGASLINHVFIEEYKNKTMALAFGYPISRRKLVMVKVLFIAAAVFASTLVSFLLAGVATYGADLVFDVIKGTPTMTDLMNFTVRMLIHSLVVALASLIPLFFFGVWKRAVIPTVICAIFLIQLPNFLGMLQITMDPDLLYAILGLLGMASVYLSVRLVNRFGNL